MNDRPGILWLVALKEEPEYFCQINILSFGLQCDLFKLLPIIQIVNFKVLQIEYITVESLYLWLLMCYFNLKIL